jgi:hypothetical protein
MTNAGRIGIGTASPGATLQVSGNVNSSSYQAITSASITSQGAYLAWNSAITGGARGETDFINQVGLGSGGWNWYSYNNSNQLSANCAFLSATGGLTLGTYSNVSVAPSGGLICPGNVGIGTTSPSFSLDVSGTTSTTGTIRAITTSQGSGVAGAQLRLMELNDTFGFAFQNINALRLGLLYYNGGAGVECMSVSRGNGNVGIGATSPAGRLAVVTSGDAVMPPSVWDSTVMTVGQGGATTSSCVGIGYNNTSNYGILYSLGPSVAWREMRYNAASHAFHIAGVSTPVVKISSTGANIGAAYYSGSTTSFTGPYFVQSSGFDSAGTNHTIQYASFAGNTVDNFGGLMIIVAKNTSPTSGKAACATYSVTKRVGTGTTLSVVNTNTNNMTAWTYGTSSNDIVIITDSDVAISWTFIAGA